MSGAPPPKPTGGVTTRGGTSTGSSAAGAPANSGQIRAHASIDVSEEREPTVEEMRAEIARLNRVIEAKREGGEPAEDIAPQQEEKAAQPDVIAPGAPASAVSIQQATHLTAAEEPLPRLRGIEPNRLQYAEASKVRVLEDWFYDVEQMLIQQKKEAAPFSTQLRMMGPYWDREVAQRIQGRMGELAAQKAPVNTWTELQGLIREQFLSTVDEETAYNELVTLRMPPKERMDEYVQRGVAVSTRISQKRVPQHMKADFMLAGVQRVRFPILVATIEKEQRDRRKQPLDQGMGVNEMRDRLVELARSEPTEVMAAATGGNPANPQVKPQSRWQQRQQTTTPTALAQKLNAIGINLEASASSSTAEQQDQQITFTSEEVRHLLNAVGPSSDKKWPCGRCRKTGHTTRECRTPDTRRCYNCGETGHIRPNCQKPKKDTTGRSSIEGEKSKNA